MQWENFLARGRRSCFLCHAYQADVSRMAEPSSIRYKIEWLYIIKTKFSMKIKISTMLAVDLDNSVQPCYSILSFLSPSPNLGQISSLITPSWRIAVALGPRCTSMLFSGSSRRHKVNSRSGVLWRNDIYLKSEYVDERDRLPQSVQCREQLR
jgi:hypothetical protein